MFVEIQNFIARRIPIGILSARHIEADIPKGHNETHLVISIAKGRRQTQIAKARIVLPTDVTRHRETLLVRRRRRRLRLANRH